MGEKKIGDLNGPWAVLLKLGLILIPIWIAWSAWVTASVFEHEKMVSDERIITNNQIEVKVDAIKSSITALSSDIGEIKVSIAKLPGR